MTMKRGLVAVAVAVVLAGCAGQGMEKKSQLGFFVSSTGSGKGADFGGLVGADALCQKLATAAGAGDRTWRAYLSTQASGSTPAVNAKDRIGTGPWKNAKGEVIAKDVADLHGGSNNLTKQTALTETGAVVNGRGDTPNEHDILTGTQPNGTAFAVAEDKTCGNWTKSGDGSAVVGHHDRAGLPTVPVAEAISWNSSHGSRGCSVDQLKASGGAGKIYCFASN
jgi:hypothetical protein